MQRKLTLSEHRSIDERHRDNRDSFLSILQRRLMTKTHIFLSMQLLIPSLWNVAKVASKINITYNGHTRSSHTY